MSNIFFWVDVNRQLAKYRRGQSRDKEQINWLIYYVIDPVDGLVDYWVARLIDWFTNWSIGPFTDWLIDWLVDWLIDWLVDWLIGWLIDRCCSNRTSPSATDLSTISSTRSTRTEMAKWTSSQCRRTNKSACFPRQQLPLPLQCRLNKTQSSSPLSIYMPVIQRKLPCEPKSYWLIYFCVSYLLATFAPYDIRSSLPSIYDTVYDYGRNIDINS